MPRIDNASFECFIKGCLIAYNEIPEKSHDVTILQKKLFKLIEFKPNELDECTIKNLSAVYRKSEFFRYPYQKGKKPELTLLKIKKELVTDEHHKLTYEKGEVSDMFVGEVMGLVLNITQHLRRDIQETFFILVDKYTETTQ